MYFPHLSHSFESIIIYVIIQSDNLCFISLIGYCKSSFKFEVMFLKVAEYNETR